MNGFAATVRGGDLAQEAQQESLQEESPVVDTSSEGLPEPSHGNPVESVSVESIVAESDEAEHGVEANLYPRKRPVMKQLRKCSQEKL